MSVSVSHSARDRRRLVRDDGCCSVRLAFCREGSSLRLVCLLDTEPLTCGWLKLPPLRSTSIRSCYIDDLKFPKGVGFTKRNPMFIGELEISKIRQRRIVVALDLKFVLDRRKTLPRAHCGSAARAVAGFGQVAIAKCPISYFIKSCALCNAYPSTRPGSTPR